MNTDCTTRKNNDNKTKVAVISLMSIHADSTSKS